MHESCSTCQAEFVCSVHGNNPPECVTNPDGSLLSWNPWTNDEVSTISDQVYRLCNYANRLRISHLRRMKECAMDRRGFAICYLSTRDAMRWDRFIDVVEKDIARLRGEG